MIVPVMMGTTNQPSGQTADPNTVLLLHMNGADDGTTFTDSALGGDAPHTMTPGGGAVTKTGVKKLGSASGYFDGDAYLSTSDSADWTWGAGDFTLEAYMYTTSTTPNQQIIMGIWPSDSYYLAFGLYKDPPSILTYQLTFFARNTGGTASEIRCAFNPSTSTWYHVMYARASGVVKLFIDGVSQTLVSNTNPNLTLSDLATDLHIGQRPRGSYNYPWIGNLDEVRISNMARYTSDFTPPVAEYSPYT